MIMPPREHALNIEFPNVIVELLRFVGEGGSVLVAEQAPDSNSE
jgi:hypothetical protein